MVNFSELQEIEASIEVLFGSPESMDLKSISSSLSPEEETFIFVKSQKYLDEIGRLAKRDNYKNSGIMLESSFYEKIKDEASYQQLAKSFAWGACVKDVNQAMCSLSKIFYDKKFGELNYYVDGRQMGNADVDPTAKIAQNVFVGTHVFIGKNVIIMPGVTIMPHVSIDDNSVIYPNVTIYPFCKVGKNCRIHASTVIGADGFGYNFYGGVHNKIWHLAGVEISDNVEIGGAAMIDAGAFISTKIGEGSKLDNFCQISHNVQVGKHCVLAGGAGSAGSGEIGDYCAFGARAGLAPGARVGNQTMLGANAIVSENSSWPDKSVLAGHPARPMKQWLKAQAKLRQLIK